MSGLLRRFKHLSPLLLAGGISLAGLAAEVRQLDRVAAIVNDDVVMASEVDAEVEAIYRRLARSGGQAPPREVLLPKVLDKLILDRLQLNIANRAGVKISDTELNQTLARIAQQQGMSLEQFVQMARDDGMTTDKLRARIANEMLIAQVQQARVQRRITISDQEIDNFLNTEAGKIMASPDVHLGHILIAVPAGAPRDAVDAALAKARGLREQVLQGGDFRQLAIANSTGPQALQGGDLGWRKAAQLPELFAAAIANLAPGEISEPLRSDAGIHLLKLYERRDSAGEQIVEQSNAQHILVKANEVRSEDDCRNLLSELRARALKGEDFSILAKQFSEDPGSALAGGNLGWSMPEQFVPDFERVLNSTPVGSISEPFRTQFGWHIVRVIDRRKQDFSKEIMRNQAKNFIRHRKFEEELQLWLQEIRDEAYVEIKK